MEALDAVVRTDRAQIIAHLARLLGDLEKADDVFQAALATAFEAWSSAGVPAKPGAWLMRTAHNRALDELRRARRAQALAPAPDDEAQPAVDEGELYPDDRLRLVFTCCHPSLAPEAQVALTLRLVCGLETPQVARAFVVTEATIQQRIVRAKRLLRESRVPFEVPEPEQLPARLASVLRVVHQVFNEGYTAASLELQAEALRLGELVVELMPEQPEARGLLALMRLQASRGPARLDARGALVLLEEQDRAKWDRSLIETGLDALRIAESFGAPGPYQLQAHIAACHARAARWDDTDWRRIAALYEALEAVEPSAIVALNRSVAVAMVDGPAAGLQLLERGAAVAALAGYYLLPATRADFLRRLGRTEDAAREYQKALGLTANPHEREFLERRLKELAVGSSRLPTSQNLSR